MLHSVTTCGVLGEEPSTSVGTKPCFVYAIVGVVVTRFVVVVVLAAAAAAAAAADDDDDDDASS